MVSLAAVVRMTLGLLLVRNIEPMRYRPEQYDQTACDGLKSATQHGACPPTCEGLGLAGDVCPVVLSCSGSNDCSKRPLVGFGFNPTIVRAPEHLRRGGVEFIGTDRFEQNNRSVTGQRAQPGGVGRRKGRGRSTGVGTVVH